MLWMAASGMLFAILNTAMKWLAHDLHPWDRFMVRQAHHEAVLRPSGLTTWAGRRP
jgi:hypothetical protein